MSILKSFAVVNLFAVFVLAESTMAHTFSCEMIMSRPRAQFAERPLVLRDGFHFRRVDPQFDIAEDGGIKKVVQSYVLNSEFDVGHKININIDYSNDLLSNPLTSSAEVTVDFGIIPPLYRFLHDPNRTDDFVIKMSLDQNQSFPRAGTCMVIPSTTGEDLLNCRSDKCLSGACIEIRVMLEQNPEGDVLAKYIGVVSTGTNQLHVMPTFILGNKKSEMRPMIGSCNIQ